MEQIVKRKKRKENNKKRIFWKVYFIYLGILVVLVAILLRYVWITLIEYENSQPEHLIEQVITELEQGDISEVEYNLSSKFEDKEVYTQYILDSVKGKTLSYKNNEQSYDPLNPIYDVDSNDTTLAQITLKEISQTHKMGFLTISKWEITQVMAEVIGNENTVKVTLPTTYKVYLNDIELGQEEQLGDISDMEGFEYIAEYIDVPQMVTYEVDGLIETPTLQIMDDKNVEIDISEYDNFQNVEIPYVSSEMDQELSDYSYRAAKAYSDFFSKDLEGCSQSTACLQPFFPDNSYYINLAEQYRQGDMWMFSEHSTPTYSNIEINNYIRYKEDCYSCEIVFDKTMILTLTGATRIDHNDQTYYFVKIKDDWLIADIKDNIGN